MIGIWKTALTISGLRRLCESHGYHVWSIGQYPDNRIVALLGAAPGWSEADLADLRDEIEDRRPVGVVIWAGT